MNINFCFHDFAYFETNLVSVEVNCNLNHTVKCINLQHKLMGSEFNEKKVECEIKLLFLLLLRLHLKYVEWECNFQLIFIPFSLIRYLYFLFFILFAKHFRCETIFLLRLGYIYILEIHLPFFLRINEWYINEKEKKTFKVDCWASTLWIIDWKVFTRMMCIISILRME